MRVISGIYGGRRFTPPKNLPVRPTTEIAKEALFNILTPRIDFEKTKVLDLFCGTGSIGVEFSSRGCPEVTFVDKNFNCCKFVKYITGILDANVLVQNNDVFKLLGSKTNKPYELIFADPPYGIDKLETLPELIFEYGWIKSGGLFILEHGPEHSFENHPKFEEMRKYGSVHFSFFNPDSESES